MRVEVSEDTVNADPRLVSWADQVCQKSCFCPCREPCLAAGAPTLGAGQPTARPVLRRFDRSGRPSGGSQLKRATGSRERQ